jgi:spore germination cell wall hydrolase CwlJ-like protein
VGQQAVAEVVLARTHSRLYPDTICGVVYQGSERTTGCQFSFTCDGSKKRTKQEAAWDEAQLLAAKIVNGSIRLAGQTKNAMFYHTVDVEPVWSRSMLKVTQIGNHIFYRHMPKSMKANVETAAETAKATRETAEVQVADLRTGGA